VELVAERDGFARVNNARAAIAEIRATPNHPAYNPQAANHKHAREELWQSYELAYPPESFNNETKE
jgi:hypothetical protein